MGKIYEIIGKHLRNETTPDEENHLNNWISEERGNRSIFQEVKSLWQGSSDLRSEKTVEVDRAWIKFLKKTHAEPKDNQRFLTRTVFRRSVAAASVFFAAFFIYLYFSTFSYDLKLEASTEVIQNMQLPDGSMVWLDKNTTLEFEKGDKYRNVKLTGQAYFEVSPNPHRPFIISTGDLKTQVVGTSFDVDYRGAEIQISVVSGKVKVYKSGNEGEALLLTKGLGASYDSENKELDMINTLDQNFLAWKTGILKFEDTPLIKVVEVLSNHYSVNIPYQGSGAPSRLTAEFDNLKLKEVMELIQLTTDIILPLPSNDQTDSK